MIVWDQKADPPATMNGVLCWQSYAHGHSSSSVPRYLEDHAERIKNKYLAFIHDLGESRIDGKRVVDHLDPGDGFSLWWMTHLAEKSPFKSPRIYDCLRLLALEEILLDRKPSDLTFCSSDLDLAQAVRQLCRNLQIPFVWQPGKQSKEKWSLRRLYRGLPYPVQGLISFARYLVLRWPLRKLQKPQWFSGSNAIFLCSYFIHLDPVSCAAGHFNSRHWGSLPRHLHQRGRRTNWIQHFLFSPEVPKVKTAMKWLRLFAVDPDRQGHHLFLESYLTARVVGRALKEWIWLNVVAWRLKLFKFEFYPQGSAAWLWPLLRGDWLSSITGPIGLNNCLWIGLFEAALGSLPRQKLGLYLFENQGWECALLRAWRRHGHGEIIGVQHATVPFWHLYYFEDARSLTSSQSCAKPRPHRIALNGPMAWKAFVSMGYSVDRLIEVEALRYLDLASSRARRRVRWNAESPSGNLHTLRVLIIGDIIADSTRSLLRLVETSLSQVASTCQLTLKPHPSNPVDPKNHPRLEFEISTGALSQICGDFDVAVVAYSTSASLDAYLAGVPVIIHLDGNVLNLSPLRGHPGVCFVTTADELAAVLREKEQNSQTSPDPREFFFLDQKLPRWTRLLGLDEADSA